MPDTLLNKEENPEITNPRQKLPVVEVLKQESDMGKNTDYLKERGIEPLLLTMEDCIEFHDKGVRLLRLSNLKDLDGFWNGNFPTYVHLYWIFIYEGRIFLPKTDDDFVNSVVIYFTRRIGSKSTD